VKAYFAIVVGFLLAMTVLLSPYGFAMIDDGFKSTRPKSDKASRPLPPLPTLFKGVRDTVVSAPPASVRGSRTSSVSSNMSVDLSDV